MRRKVDTVQEELPDEAQTSIVNDEFGDVYGIIIGLTAEGYSYHGIKKIADQVKDELLRLSESAKVDTFGEQEEQIFIEYDNAKLAKLGISPSQLSEQLASRNIVIPGGSIDIGIEKIALEPTGNFESSDDIGKTIIQIPGSNGVQYLRDLVTISRGYIDPVKSKVSLNGQSAMSIAVSMREGGNNILLGQQVNELLAQLTAAYPIGIEFELVSFYRPMLKRK